MSEVQARLDQVESARGLVTSLTDSLAQVLESMTDQRPSIEWDAEQGPWTEVRPAEDEKILWWEQLFQLLPRPVVWVGTPQATWEELGGRTLKAAGLETVETGEARQTWMEILSQALSTLARATGSMIGAEVTCSTGAENAPPSDITQWARIRMSFESALPPLWVAFAPALLERLQASPQSEPHSAAAEEHEADGGAPAAGRDSGYARTLGLLLDVELPISISFGRTQIPLKDVLKLTTGSIVELNRSVNEAVEVLVNHSLIARGEVVVIEGNYGVRIQEIVSPQDRLRTVR